MSAVCRGCGVRLQYTDRTLPGYTPKEGSAYCQRCFRLIHYDDLTVSMREGIDPETVLKGIEELDAVIVWVVDLFDFETGMIPGFGKRLTGRDIILVCTKRDLLPADMNDERTARFVFARLKEYGVKVKRLIFSGRGDREAFGEVKNAVREIAGERKAAVIGRANAGKSTLLNGLLGSDVLTSSRYPGTTLEFNELEIDGMKWIDTPGIETPGSLAMYVEEKDLKDILPARAVKPVIFQLHNDQCFSIGGLAQVYFHDCDGATAVFYLSDRLSIHRTKAENGDKVWEKHLGEDFVPVPVRQDYVKRTARKHETKEDIVIDGLGWVCMSGHVGSVTVRVPRGVDVTFRKAML